MENVPFLRLEVQDAGEGLPDSQPNLLTTTHSNNRLSYLDFVARSVPGWVPSKIRPGDTAHVAHEFTKLPSTSLDCSLVSAVSSGHSKVPIRNLSQRLSLEDASDWMWGPAHAKHVICYWTLAPPNCGEPPGTYTLVNPS